MSTTYDASTGEVRTNGELTHSVRVCKFTGHALLYRVEKHWPKLYVSDFVESFGARHRSPMMICDPGSCMVFAGKTENPLRQSSPIRRAFGVT